MPARPLSRYETGQIGEGFRDFRIVAGCSSRAVGLNTPTGLTLLWFPASFDLASPAGPRKSERSHSKLETITPASVGTQRHERFRHRASLRFRFSGYEA